METSTILEDGERVAVVKDGRLDWADDTETGRQIRQWFDRGIVSTSARGDGDVLIDEPKLIKPSDDMFFMAVAEELDNRDLEVQEGSVSMSWESYDGPRGGKGWKHSSTGEIRYQDEKPEEHDPRDKQSESRSDTSGQGEYKFKKIPEYTMESIQKRANKALNNKKFRKFMRNTQATRGGKPMVLYNASPKEMKTLGDQRRFNKDGGGMFFAETPRTAEFGDNVIAAFLNITDPYTGSDEDVDTVVGLFSEEEAKQAVLASEGHKDTSDAAEWLEENHHESFVDALRDKLMSSTAYAIWQDRAIYQKIKTQFDGVMSEDPFGGSAEYIAFSPKQIIPIGRIPKQNRMSLWQPYTGERGGRGWINKQTNEVRYQAERPGETEARKHTEAIKTSQAQKKAAGSRRNKMLSAKFEGKTLKLADGGDLPEHVAATKIFPGWTDIKVNANPDSPLIATGMDSKGRKQYVYSADHKHKQSAAKFQKIRKLDKAYDSIKKKNAANIKNEETREEALITFLIMETGCRPGSSTDTKAEKQAYGATTLLAKHVVKRSDGKVTLKFTGKKGVDLSIPLGENLSRYFIEAKQSAGGPNKRLFNVSDGKLRDYVDKIAPGFSPKDFRTLLGTRIAIKKVVGAPLPQNEKSYKKKLKEVATAVSSRLGNTPAVALNAYIDPTVFSSWREAVGV